MDAIRVERGTTLQGEYVLLECIGDTNGLVFRAQRRRDGAFVIVRVFAVLEGELRERLLEHAARAGRVRHPVLAAVSAFGVNGDDVYVVEELVEGRSIAMLTERSGIPPLARAVEIALQLCRGLESAHRHGVAHDALDPDNVLLRGGAGEASPLQVRLLDLSTPGFVRPWPPALSRALYMAPEQLAQLRVERSACSATPAMNLYSIAALLYDLCTGGPPLPAGSLDELAEAHAAERLMPPSRINPQIPSMLDTVLLRALSRDPARRFAGVGELIEALSGLRLSSSVSGVQPVSVLPRSPSGRAPEPERATWHGGFDERPTSKIELPPEHAMAPTPLRPPPLAAHPTVLGLPRPPQLPRPLPAPRSPAAEASSASSAPPARRSSAPPSALRSSAPQSATRRSAPPPALRSAPPPDSRRSAPPGAAPELALPPPPGVDPALAAAEPSLHASTPPPAARRSTPPRGAFSAVTPTPVPTPSDPRRLRALWLGWSVVGIAAVAAFWYAMSLPLPQEHVRTTRLAALPEPAPKPELRAWSRPVPPAPASDAPAPTSLGSQAHPTQPVERVEPAREPQRSARGGDARARSAPRASAPAVRDEAQRSERSSRSEFDAHVALPDGLVTTDEPTRAVLTPEPERAQASIESEPTTAVPTDPPAGPKSEARVATVAKPLAETPRAAPPTSALRARVSALAVRGSLPSSQVAQGIERVVPQLNECYRKAAAAVGPALPRRVQVELELDEQGRARKPNVRGASAPGLAACVTTAVGRVASRRAPDTGTVTATFTLELAP
jgi:eukaryotic-like serine/threonine-protein kinase